MLKVVKVFKKTIQNQKRFAMSGLHPHLELDIPKLPIPPLEQTCNKYLKVLQTLVTKEELENTKKIVEGFLKNEGPIIQEKLIEHDKTQPHSSYIEEFWDDMYLELRCPNPIWVNPYFLLQRGRDEKKSQLERSAQIVASSVRLYQRIQSNKMNYDLEGITPLCMSQYGRLFGSYRIPLKGRDELITKVSRHIVVMSMNQFYKLDVINENGTLMSEEEIISNLNSIINNSKISESIEKDYPLGIFTTEDRDIWADYRKHLEEISSVNRNSISIVDSALFILVLEETSPTNINESSNIVFHGNGQNRWFDKLQVIVMKNGRAGLNMEHSGFDGHTLLIYASNIYNDHISKVNTNQKSVPIISTNITKITYQKLSWDIDEKIKKGIQEAIPKFDEFCAKTNLSVLKFENYGKLFITRNKMSPDAYVQMAYQLTYYRMFGKVGQSYESVNTKQFLHGRTETGRPATFESTIFTKLMEDKNVDDQSKIQALRKACVAHVEELRVCKNGFGVDRHFFALQGIVKKEQKTNPNFPIPELYKDKSYRVLKTDLMSTSNCGEDDALDLFGFGPTSDSGFGIGYVVKDNRMVFNVTHFENRSEEFTKTLNRVLLDMRDLVERC